MSVITISKETGCGDDVCEIVAKHNGYKILNKEMVKYVSLLSDISLSDANDFDEHNHSSINAVLSNYVDFSIFKTKSKKEIPTEHSEYSDKYAYSQSSSGETFQSALEKIMRMTAREGNAMIIGRGSNFILKDIPSVYHVRFIAPLEMRAKNISSSQGIDIDSATQYATETDLKKASFVKHYFDKDIKNPKHYHLVINLGMLSAKQAAEQIISLIKHA